VDDRDGLENRCRCKPTVGSNPTLSATRGRCNQRPFLFWNNFMIIYSTRTETIREE
jgi:hypothetical protein